MLESVSIFTANIVTKFPTLRPICARAVKIKFHCAALKVEVNKRVKKIYAVTTKACTAKKRITKFM